MFVPAIVAYILPAGQVLANPVCEVTASTAKTCGYLGLWGMRLFRVYPSLRVVVPLRGVFVDGSEAGSLAHHPCLF